MFVMLFLASAGVLGYHALRRDAPGAASNLVADVLAGAAITVVIREIAVARERRRFLANYRPIYQRVLNAIGKQREHYSEMATWASRRLTEQTADSNARLDLLLDGVGFGIAPDRGTLEAGLQALTTDYGSVDFSHLFAEFQEHCGIALSTLVETQRRLKSLSDDQPLFVLPKNDTAKHSQSRRVTLELVTRDMDRLAQEARQPVRDLERIEGGLQDLYAPRIAVARYHPEPFARWLLVLIICLAALSFGALAASFIVPRALPSNFGAATVDNLLAAGVAGFMAATVATIERFTTNRRLLVRALPPGTRLHRTLAHIGETLGMTPEEDRARLLRAIGDEVRDCVNQLQHVIPDARLGGYADNVLADIDAALARSGDQDYLDVPAETMTALGMPGMRAPSPAAMRLVMAGSHLGSRVTEMYFSQRPL